jgi:hypothetical protein
MKTQADNQRFMKIILPSISGIGMASAVVWEPVGGLFAALPISAITVPSHSWDYAHHIVLNLHILVYWSGASVLKPARARRKVIITVFTCKRL